MVSTLSFILIVFLVVFADTALGRKEPVFDVTACRAQETYSIASQITPPLSIKLYYHAGIEPDYGYLKGMCTIKKQFSQVTITFVVGEGVTQGENGLLCLTNDGNFSFTSDCTNNLIHVCASQLVDFNTWMECTVDGGTAGDCMLSQDANIMDAFDQCVQLTHPTIKADQILLKNAKEASEINNPTGCKPILLFNNVLSDDDCTRFTIREDPVKVINALLKDK